jgi:DNA-binding MarR family transcriptional regulator
VLADFRLYRDTMLSDREYRALARFRHALRVFVRFSEEAARAHGVTPAQHQLLLAIRGHDGVTAPTVGDMADALQQQHHSVVELVNRAADAGLVVRTADPDDRRRQRLALTHRGQTVIEELSTAHRAELRRYRTELLAALETLG